MVTQAASDLERAKQTIIDLQMENLQLKARLAELESSAAASASSASSSAAAASTDAAASDLLTPVKSAAP